MTGRPLAGRRLLVAGSWGPERVPARPHPDHADWYLPLHLRDQREARQRMAAQVATGADIVVAATWLTHRRALLPLGETRRAGDWTTAAVRIARQGIDLGLEQREEQLAEAPLEDLRRGRPRPLVAAVLAALDAHPEAGSGRLLPREAAAERDYRDQAGILADAEPDLLLVEGQRTESEARLAMTQAIDTGLPVWAALNEEALGTTGLVDWLEWGTGAGLERLLLPPPLEARLAVAGGELSWGSVAAAVEAIPAWLDMGATAIALLDGASTAALEPHRAAIDDYERAEIEARRAAEGRWLAHVEHAAAMAPGGAAAWIGPQPDTPLPEGFDWRIIAPRETRQLPQGQFRLVVSTADDDADAGRLLERGGILVQRGPRRSPGELRVLAIDADASPILTTCRRET